MNNLIDQISINKDIVYNPDSAYDLLYHHFSSGAINNLTDTELERLLLKLRLKIGFILESSAKHNHTNFLQFILNLSVNSCLDGLKISQGLYGDLIIIAAQNSNLEILRFLIKLISEPDQFDSINVNIKFNKMGIAHKKQIKSFIQIGKFVLELLEHLSENKNLNIDGDKAYNYIKDHYIDTALCFAAHIGHKEILEYIFDFTPDPEIRYKLLHNSLNYDPFALTALHGHLDSLKFLFGLLKDNKERLTTILRHDREVLKNAAHKGSIEVFKYLIEFIPDRYISKILHDNDNIIFNNAIKSGNLGFIKYIIEITPRSLIEKKIVGTCSLIRLNNQVSLDILKFLLILIKYNLDIFRIITCSDYYLFRKATTYGRLDIVKYLVKFATENHITKDIIFTISRKAFTYSVKFGHLDIVKYLVELISDRNIIKDIILNEEFYHSVENGHINIVKFLVSLLPDQETIKNVIMAYKAYTSNDTENINMICLAAKHGHIDIFKYLIAVYCDNTINTKFIKSNIDIIIKHVVIGGQTHLLKFLLEFDDDKQLLNKIFSDKFYTNSLFYETVLRKNIEITIYIVETFIEEGHNLILLQSKLDKLGETITNKCLEENDLDFLYYFLKIPYSRSLRHVEVINKAAEYGRVDIIELLLKVYPKKDDISKIIKALTSAAYNGHIEVLNYIAKIFDETGDNILENYNNYLFPSALSGGYEDIIDLLFENNPSTLQMNAIVKHAYETFKCAAYEGNIDTLKLIVKLSPESIGLMLSYDNFSAFRNASKFGHVHIMKYLLDLTEEATTIEGSKPMNCFNNLLYKTMVMYYGAPSNNDESGYRILDNIREKMIHANDDEAFRLAASSDHLGSMNYLLTLVQDTDSKRKMIQSNNNQVFKEAIKNSKIHIVEFLLESFLNDETNNNILYPDIEEAIAKEVLVQYIGDIDLSVDY